MFDIGWTELAVIALVALLVIGPKDLPYVFHSLGQWVRKARMAAGEFQRHVDDMVRDAELQDVAAEVKRLKVMGKYDALKKMGQIMDPEGRLAGPLDPTQPYAPLKPVDQASMAAAATSLAKAAPGLVDPAAQSTGPAMPGPTMKAAERPALRSYPRVEDEAFPVDDDFSAFGAVAPVSGREALPPAPPVTPLDPGRTEVGPPAVGPGPAAAPAPAPSAPSAGRSAPPSIPIGWTP